MRTFRFLGCVGLGFSLNLAPAFASGSTAQAPTATGDGEVMEVLQPPPAGATPPAAPPAAPTVRPATPPPGTDMGGASSIFNQMPQTAGSAQSSYNPSIMGDLSNGNNLLFRQLLLNRGFGGGVGAGGGGGANTFATNRIPIISRGAFKVAENESPVPDCNRAYVTYDFFYDLNPGQTGIGIPRQNLHRETFGWEYGFGQDCDFSVGIRLPYLQPEGGALGPTALGDLSFLTKYAIFNNRDTGNAISVGLMVTAPTATAVVEGPNGEKIHPTLLQPFIGYRFVPGDFIVQGFLSTSIPTDDNEGILLFNDVQFGYMYHRDVGSFVTLVMPVFEVHVNTGLNHPTGTTVPGGFSDSVIFTHGVQLYSEGGSSSQLGLAYPLTGPRPFDLQVLVQWNFRF